MLRGNFVAGFGRFSHGDLIVFGRRNRDGEAWCRTLGVVLRASCCACEQGAHQQKLEKWVFHKRYLRGLNNCGGLNGPSFGHYRWVTLCWLVYKTKPAPAKRGRGRRLSPGRYTPDRPGLQTTRPQYYEIFSKRQSRILSFLTENFFFSIQCVSMDAFVYVDRFRILAQAECKERLP